MRIKKIYYTPSLKKSWQRLPLNVKKKAVRKEKLFRRHAFHPSLLTHKLTGKLKNYWSFSIGYHTRIVLRLLKEGEVLFVDVGTHDIYK